MRQLGIQFVYLLVFFGHALGFGHGLHALEKNFDGRAIESAQFKDLGGVVAVKFKYPLLYDRCAATFDLEEASCDVLFEKNNIAHVDYRFPIPKIIFSEQEEVHFLVFDHGYRVQYWGEALTKEEQLSKVKESFVRLKNKGITHATVQAYLPTSVAKNEGGVETVFLGKIIGVKRRIPIRLADCKKTFKGNACSIQVVEESKPDHPGPSGGGDEISKNYSFSESENVSIRLTDLYGNTQITYSGPLVSSLEILDKIEAAIEHLKGNSKELYLECTMFTLERSLKTKSLPYIDEKIASAVYFEAEMPLSYELCEKNLNLPIQKCDVHFTGAGLITPLDHAGGGESRDLFIEGEGEVNLFGTYIENDPYWSLSYGFLSSGSMNPKLLIRQAFNSLAEMGVHSIKGFGFRAGH